MPVRLGTTDAVLAAPAAKKRVRTADAGFFGRCGAVLGPGRVLGCGSYVLGVLVGRRVEPTPWYKSGKDRTDYLGYGAIRPRIALKTPAPGPADKSPLPDLAANTPKSPSTDDATPGSSRQNDQPPAQEAAPNSGEGATAPWIALGVGAAALLGIAVAVPVICSRRR